MKLNSAWCYFVFIKLYDLSLDSAKFSTELQNIKLKLIQSPEFEENGAYLLDLLL